eukprot:CAMPEP_0113935644 /NCGR_PEP_ID=MMETSP1339-20121228/2762_1 /TAXON_ID=94617 /ORGANISM="Fibrocapsa japonica" /LENGTH=268 /DNA_ID=CAMNT_0000937871 /DNA_START=104 /DNA_END=907 /DNA_ORIENTATION=+ /assembly_acc=CAM_ASM_000762
MPDTTEKIIQDEADEDVVEAEEAKDTKESAPEESKDEEKKDESKDEEADGGDKKKDESAPDDRTSDGRKLFVGGLAWETTEDTVNNYFSRFTSVETVMLLKDRVTGRSRGFGFVTIKDKADVEKVLKMDHKLDGRDLKVNMATPEGSKAPRAEEGGENYSKKVYVGDLATSVNEAKLREAFEEFGKVESVQILRHPDTGTSRGFGFVTFEEVAGAGKALESTPVKVAGGDSRVTRAQPKRYNDGPRGGGGGAGGRGGRGGRGGYGSGG